MLALRGNWWEGQQRTEQAVNSPHPIAAEATHAEADLPNIPPVDASLPRQPLVRRALQTLLSRAYLLWMANPLNMSRLPVSALTRTVRFPKATLIASWTGRETLASRPVYGTIP